MRHTLGKVAQTVALGKLPCQRSEDALVVVACGILVRRTETPVKVMATEKLVRRDFVLFRHLVLHPQVVRAQDAAHKEMQYVWLVHAHGRSIKANFTFPHDYQHIVLT